jgi:hypothetical protein
VALAALPHLYVLGLEHDAVSALPNAAQDAILVHERHGASQIPPFLTPRSSGRGRGWLPGNGEASGTRDKGSEGRKLSSIRLSKAPFPSPAQSRCRELESTRRQGNCSGGPLSNGSHRALATSSRRHVTRNAGAEEAGPPGRRRGLRVNL